MGAVCASKGIYDAFMQGPAGRDRAFPRLHLLGPPVACAAGTGVAEHLPARRACSTRAKAIARHWEDAVHALQGRAQRHRPAHLRPDRRHRARADPGRPGARGYEVGRGVRAGLLVRVTGDMIALSPPLIIERKHVDQIFGTLAAIIDRLD